MPPQIAQRHCHQPAEAHTVSLLEPHHFGVGAAMGSVSVKKDGRFSLFFSVKENQHYSERFNFFYL